MEEYRKHHPTFDYVVFDRDPHGYVFSLPLESSVVNMKTAGINYSEEKCAELLLGSVLYTTIFKEDIFKNY